MKKALLLALPSLVLLAGCGSLTTTDYARPDIEMPALWQSPVRTASGVTLSAWWETFNDPVLNRLVDEALAKNNDLAAAALKVKAAKLAADLAWDQNLPDLSASGSLSNSRSLRRNQTITRTYGAALDVGYEVDLWGKLAHEADSAAWEALATEQDRQSAAVALIGTTINLYWKIAYLNERITLSERSLSYRRESLALAKIQHDAGASSGIDEAAVAQSLAEQEAAHRDYMQQRSEALHAFAILFDEPPETLKAFPAALPKTSIPNLPANTPASLLERRPDLRAAELRLREALADTDATRASYMPTLSLTGSLGSTSDALAKILTNPVGALGAGIALPFLNWYDAKKNTEISETAYEEAVVSFRQTLYSALAEVEDALSAHSNDAKKGKKLATALAQAQKAEALYAEQYKQGYADKQTWLDAQEKARAAQVSVLENRLTQLTDTITLYKALGGDAGTR
ncbi:MAG: efflux transporter outer membrane subunit [Alphaproteobacteria bacterium]|nr:efflux transporter outer membrane subunit [Alphaproteobacteria bacterium]